MRKKMPKTAVKSPSFDAYKTIKDEIIEISELRFENILNKKFDAFRRDFKKELMGEIDAKFEGIYARFNSMDSKFKAFDFKFDAMNSKFDAMNSKFDAINSKFDAVDSKIGSVNSKIETLKWSVWSLPIVITVLMGLFTLLLKFIVKI
jgi:uncharacterized protein YdcH (DUF465 family)